MSEAATIERSPAAPDDESCVGCEYAGGIVLHYCKHAQSEFYRGFVDWDGWCPQWVPRRIEDAPFERTGGKS